MCHEVRLWKPHALIDIIELFFPQDCTDGARGLGTHSVSCWDGVWVGVFGLCVHIAEQPSSTWPQSHFYLMSTSSIKLFSGWHWSTFVPLEGLTWFSIWHSVTQLKLGPCCLCVPVKEKAHHCRPHLQSVCAMRFTAMGLAWVTLSTLRKQNSRHKPQ